MDRSAPGWKRYVSVQPPITLYLFAVSMSGNILTDLIVHRTCTISLGINRTECLILDRNSSSPEAARIDALVQPRTSLILSSKACIDSIIPACLSLILGAWSDQFGRKPLLKAGYTGVTLTFLTLSMVASWEISPWFILIAYVPSAILGGSCAIILASICYINDISGEKDRAWQLAWLNTMLFIGVLIGMLTGPVLRREYGYTSVFGVATLACLMGTAYVWYCVPETIGNRSTRNRGSLFNGSLVKELVKTCTKKREGFDRWKAWCCIACLVLLAMNLDGEVTIGYLFANARLGWNVSQYSICSATGIIVTVSGTLVGMMLLKTWAGVSEELVTVVALCSSVGSSLTRAFVWRPWHMYLSIGVGTFSGLAAPSIRAILSKSVPSQDVGKVFSLTTSVETLTPLAASSLYSAVYSYTMPPMYPSVVWIVCAGVYLMAMSLIATIWTRNLRLAGAADALSNGSATESLLPPGIESSLES